MLTQALPLLEAPITGGRRIVMTFEEFLTLPESIQAEWVDGETIIFVTATSTHARVISFLLRLIGGFAEERELGEVLTAPYGMRLRQGQSFREPDLMFVASEHRERVSGIAIEGPADLVVEVISDDSTARDRADKFYEYQEGGVPEYWIYDPRPGKERADVYRLGLDGKYEPIVADSQGRLHSSVLAGFWLRVEWLRADPLPPTRTALAEILAGRPTK